MVGTVVGLTFLFGFGNVFALALRLGVPVWAASLVAPAGRWQLAGSASGVVRRTGMSALRRRGWRVPRRGPARDLRPAGARVPRDGCATLDSLLETDPAIGIPGCDGWLPARWKPRPKAVKVVVAKLEFLRSWGRGHRGLSVLPAERRRFPATFGRRLTGRAL
ncbi:hypothetical protein DMC61_33710 [Amycolatopsis sp. WAC 04169]|nr:hypothetical protein DMC61_33710 [Amycolatopsis sp. WAC 04169]